MYDLLVCTCGDTLGFLFELPILKQFNFTKQGETFVQLLEQLFKEVGQEHYHQLRHFIFISCQHFQVYQIYNTKVALELLVKQYQAMWESVPEHQLGDQLLSIVYKNKTLINIFNTFYDVKTKTQEIRTSAMNLSKLTLDSQGILKTCCRSRILTNVDFYVSRAYYASKLQQ